MMMCGDVMAMMYDIHCTFFLTVCATSTMCYKMLYDDYILLSPTEPMFCPCAVPPQSALQLKCMLQHQPWNLEYSLNPEE